MVSSVGVVCTRTFRPLMSSIFLISRLEYMLRRPSVATAMTRAPCTVSAIIALTAVDTPGSAIALIRCPSERNRKCIDITPACGDSVAALARRNAELHVACFHQLQDLRFLAELRAGILVDQHAALAHLLQLVAED